MWMRWCALGMAAGLLCVVAGLGIAVGAQTLLLRCDDAPEACEALAASRTRFAIALTLFGVIASSLSTAAVAGFLMREKRPRRSVVATVLQDPFPAAPPR